MANRYDFIKNEKSIREELAYGVYAGDIYKRIRHKLETVEFYHLQRLPMMLIIQSYDSKTDTFSYSDGDESSRVGKIAPMKLEIGYNAIKKHSRTTEGAEEVSEDEQDTLPRQTQKNPYEDEDDDWLN